MKKQKTILRVLWHLTIVMAWVAVLVAPLRIARADDDDGFVPNEVLIRLVAASDLPAISTTFNLTLLSQFGSRPIYRMSINDGMSPPDKAASLQNDARVRYAEPNFTKQIPEGRGKRHPWAIGGDAGTFATQWAPSAMRLPEAHAIQRGSGMRIAVLDTGVDMSHPLLAGKLIAGYDFVDDDADPREEGTTANFGYGHGTHVAGLVALAAPEAKIMPVRVLDPDGFGNIWVLAEGLVYAADPDGNPQTDDGAHVINLSLGTTRRTNLLEDLIRSVTCDDDDDEDDDDNDDDDDDRCVRTGGIVVVAAAGNLGNEVPHFPAAEGVPGSLAVAASTPIRTLAEFSSRGSWVQVAAPGEHVVSTVPGGQMGVWSGTSMAAPFAAGIAALIRAQNPALKAADITNLIASKASPLCGTSLKQVDAAEALGVSAPDQTPCQVFIPAVAGATCQPCS